MAWHGTVRCGRVRSGVARFGMDWLGWVRYGRVRNKNIIGGGIR